MLAILTTHPIQYQTPIWRGLAKNTELPFKVFFMSDQGIKASFDPGFNRKLAWDIDLLEGYPHEYLSVQTAAKQDAFGWLKLKPGFADMLKQHEGNECHCEHHAHSLNEAVQQEDQHRKGAH